MKTKLNLGYWELVSIAQHTRLSNSIVSSKEDSLSLNKMLGVFLKDISFFAKY